LKLLDDLLDDLLTRVSVLLVAMPIGRLGDHIGRRKVTALALLGLAGSLAEIFTVCMSTLSEFIMRPSRHLPWS
jgi:MFS family permease